MDAKTLVPEKKRHHIEVRPAGLILPRTWLPDGDNLAQRSKASHHNRPLTLEILGHLFELLDGYVPLITPSAAIIHQSFDVGFQGWRTARV